MALGILTTLCIPETARKTLEELAGEDVHSEPTSPPLAAKDGAKEADARDREAESHSA